MTGPLYIGITLVVAVATYWFIGRQVRLRHQRAEEALRRSEARYQDLYDFAPDMMALADAASGRVLQCNQTLADALGYARGEVIGRSVFDLYDLGSIVGARATFDAFFATGELDHAELTLRRKDGTAIDVSLNVSAVRDAEGRIVRGRMIWHDITLRKRAQEQLRVALAWKESMLQRERALLRELDHRVRNNLAGLMGLLRIYERSGTNVADVAAAVRGKIGAILHVHELMSPDQGAPIDLGAIVSRLADHSVDAARRASIRAGGPPVRLRATQANSMAMILQELFTNSAKHGALARSDGSIAIEWEASSQDDQRVVDLRWVERCTAARPSPPNGTRLEEGIGLKLIRGFATTDLRGACDFAFDPAGLRCTLRIRPDAHDADPLSPVPAGTASTDAAPVQGLSMVESQRKASRTTPD